MNMTIGKYKGQPISEMTTPYLMWLISNDHIRYKRWFLVVQILDELKYRFEDYQLLVSRMAVEEQPVEHWKKA